MSKCPLCGSDGDDLVFRFYCSNGECANHVLEKKEAHKEDKEILRPGEVFRFSKPEFVGRFPLRKDTVFAPKDLDLLQPGGAVSMGDEMEHMRRRVLEALRVPKGFFEPDYGSDYGSRPHELVDIPPLPRFELVMEPFDNSLFLVWFDDVPEALNMFVEPIMRKRVGEPMRASVKATTREDILQCLAGMRARGELVWNRHRSRWELHFTE